MKVFSLFALCWASLMPLSGQGVFAIVEVEFATGSNRVQRFAIDLEVAHAPLSTAAFLLLAAPEEKFFGNVNLTNSLNPFGSYRPSQADGTILPGDVTYSILVDVPGPQPNNATLVRNLSSSVMANFTRNGSTWVSDNEAFGLTLVPVGGASRFVVSENTEVKYLDETTGDVTTGPFYDGVDIEHRLSSEPYISFGRRTVDTNRSPGWNLQNEMIDKFYNDFDGNIGPWGLRFANAFGNVGQEQRFAVALANDSLIAPNTASSEILITGVAGNPDFRGRYTHIGTVVGTNYNSLQGFTVPGSRVIVQRLVDGEDAVIRSITYDNYQQTNFAPIEFLGQNPTLAPLPQIGSNLLALPQLDLTNDPPVIRTGSSPGQIRFIDGSTDLQNWSRAGQTSYPSDASAEQPLDLSNIVANNTKGFFRVNPVSLFYEEWPAEAFAATLPNAFVRFKGREVEPGQTAQVLNVFNLFLNADGDGGTLQGLSGDLNGTHVIETLTYQAAGPYRGELVLTGPTLPDTLRLRLYFDSHRLDELNSGSPLIERFHRLTIQEITTPFGTFPFEAVAEYGIWQVGV